ncbi:MAG: hypothetical protein WD942_00510 [Dehalococcoidia bacterium]
MLQHPAQRRQQGLELALQVEQLSVALQGQGRQRGKPNGTMVPVPANRSRRDHPALTALLSDSPVSGSWSATPSGTSPMQR